MVQVGVSGDHRPCPTSVAYPADAESARVHRDTGRSHSWSVRQQASLSTPRGRRRFACSRRSRAGVPEHALMNSRARLIRRPRGADRRHAGTYARHRPVGGLIQRERRLLVMPRRSFGPRAFRSRRPYSFPTTAPTHAALLPTSHDDANPKISETQRGIPDTPTVTNRVSMAEHSDRGRRNDDRDHVPFVLLVMKPLEPPAPWE